MDSIVPKSIAQFHKTLRVKPSVYGIRIKVTKPTEITVQFAGSGDTADNFEIAYDMLASKLKYCPEFEDIQVFTFKAK